MVVASTFVLLPFEPMGAIYIGAACVLGAAFIWGAYRPAARPDPAREIRFFMFSNTYLALLFAAIAVDTLVRAA